MQNDMIKRVEGFYQALVKVNAYRVKIEIIYQAATLRIGFVCSNTRMIHGIGVYRPTILTDVNSGGYLVGNVLPEFFQV